MVKTNPNRVLVKLEAENGETIGYVDQQTFLQHNNNSNNNNNINNNNNNTTNITRTTHSHNSNHNNHETLHDQTNNNLNELNGINSAPPTKQRRKFDSGASQPENSENVQEKISTLLSLVGHQNQNSAPTNQSSFNHRGPNLEIQTDNSLNNSMQENLLPQVKIEAINSPNENFKNNSGMSSENLSQTDPNTHTVSQQNQVAHQNSHPSANIVQVHNADGTTQLFLTHSHQPNPVNSMPNGHVYSNENHRQAAEQIAGQFIGQILRNDSPGMAQAAVSLQQLSNSVYPPPV